MRKCYVALIILFAMKVIAGNFEFGIKGNITPPISGFSDKAGIGFGGSFQVDYDPFANNRYFATLSVGSFIWKGKDLSQNQEIKWITTPIKIGIKTKFLREGFYLTGEGGVYLFSCDTKNLDTSISLPKHKEGYSLGVCYKLLPLYFIFKGNQMLEVFIKYEKVSDYSFLNLGIGINF